MLNPGISHNSTTGDSHYDSSLFCHDLPTRPVPRMGKVLVTGATGYVGGRLVPELLARGYQVRVMVRGEASHYRTVWPEAEVVVADALDPGSLHRAFRGVRAVYYLIHSMLLGPEDFARADREAACNFRMMARHCGVERIIYLGGLGDIRSRLSHHLRSRMEVAEELRKGEIPVTVLRAAVIIGSGSASYEIIRYLVERVPVMPLPRWAGKRCQPISIRDVIKYLVGVLEISDTMGCMFDIGGPDVLSYREVLRQAADVFNKKRFMFTLPISGVGIYSYFVSLLTPVPGPIARCLMEGVKNDVVCQEEVIKFFLPFPALSYREAIVRAMSREEQDRVHTRWSDAYPRSHELAIKLEELNDIPKYTTSYSLITSKHRGALFQSICGIGGREGWFHGNWMWRLRGMMDRIILGVGSSRGRRRYTGLNINDVVDFWRVEDIIPEKRLLLRAEMKLPGKAWLEFLLEGVGEKNRVTINAYYHTSTIWGRIYWYIFLPFHDFIFKGLLRQIVERS